MSQEFVESYSLKTSIGRMLNPIEVITPIDFLLGEGSSAITGTDLSVDGGYLTW